MCLLIDGTCEGDILCVPMPIDHEAGWRRALLPVWVSIHVLGLEACVASDTCVRTFFVTLLEKQTCIFWLQAFLAASLKTDEELLGWFNERLVWNDQGVVTEMLKSGLFVRIFAPQVISPSNCKDVALPSGC